MGRVRIIADSTCDLTQDLIKKYDITMIPLNIVLEDKSFKDGVEIIPEEIYEWADRNNTTPKTASPEIGYIIEVLKPMVVEEEEIIFIGISEDMSVTCQTVRMAAQELEYEKLYVINSMNLSTGIGLQVLRAAEYALQGMSAQKIIKEIESARDKVCASFVIDTLTYLHRGGRCSAVAALFGNALKLKPMIAVNNGKMGVRSYAKDLESQLLQADSKRVFITHSGIDSEIEQETYDYLKGLGYFKEIYITRAGGVISSHCGPNTLGILFYKM